MLALLRGSANSTYNLHQNQQLFRSDEFVGIEALSMLTPWREYLIEQCEKRALMIEFTQVAQFMENYVVN